MAKREKQKIVTKKHMARREREELQQRYIIFATIAVVAIVLILVVYALVQALIITPNQPVAVVNGEEILANDYQARVKFERFQLINQMGNTIQFMQSLGDPSTAQYFQSSLQQTAFQLIPEVHGQSVLDTMIEDVLIAQEAETRGISVSEAEIDKALANDFGYFPDGTPTAAPTSEIIPTSTLNPQQKTLVPPTATAIITETATPTLEPTPTIEAEATPSEEFPTPTAYTEQAFEEDYNNFIRITKQTIGVSEKQFREIIRAQLLREKLSDEITKDIPQEEEQVWARHILVDTEEEALEVSARLDSGEDFATLAQEVSTDTGSAVNGGDLGWFGRGRMVPEFEETAFALEIGEISDPVQSDFGWHIIQKLGHEIRPIDATTYDQLKQTVFTNWLAEQRENSEAEIFDTWREIYPETPAIPEQYEQFISQ
jgi:parvulin-like peptidyl-prolyl isomerase